MPELILESSAAATWQRVLQEAAQRVSFPLDEERESYLILTLLHYLSRPELVRGVLALRFLDALAEYGEYRKTRLRDVGDQCLIYAGLFPEQAARRRVSHRYFIDLGRTAYSEVAQGTPSSLGVLYERLSRTFDSLAEVLSALRERPDAAELILGAGAPSVPATCATDTRTRH